MNEISSKLSDRAARKNRKRDEKRQKIAESAIAALTQLGYANTSMRDIASVADLSLGMLSYYFGDKSDLIIYCVTTYKSDFVRANEAAIETPGDAQAVIEAFASSLSASIKQDAAAHRLWYDIRTQAMFDETFQPAVNQIEESLIGLVAGLNERITGDGGARVEADYGAIDGLFRFWIQDPSRVDAAALEDISESFRSLLTRLWLTPR